MAEEYNLFKLHDSTDLAAIRRILINKTNQPYS